MSHCTCNTWLRSRNPEACEICDVSMKLSSPHPFPFASGKVTSKYELLVRSGELLTSRSVYSTSIDSGGRIGSAIVAVVANADCVEVADEDAADSFAPKEEK